MIRSIFFPKGNVGKEYTRYLFWSGISNTIVSIQNVIATDSMLKSISFIPVDTRTSSYVVKDMVGQIGGVLYMTKFGQTVDKDPKRFLLFSNITQQTSMFVMSSMYMISDFYVYAAGLSSMFINISFTGYGAINSRCIQKLATSDNIGEIYAKISSLNILGSSIGMIIGLYILSFTRSETRLPIVLGLGMLRVYTFNKAIKNLLV